MTSEGNVADTGILEEAYQLINQGAATSICNVYSAVTQIIPLLKSPDPSLRANAAYALGYLGINEKETVGNALINLLSNSNICRLG